MILKAVPRSKSIDSNLIAKYEQMNTLQSFIPVQSFAERTGVSRCIVSMAIFYMTSNTRTAGKKTHTKWTGPARSIR